MRRQTMIITRENDYVQYYNKIICLAQYIIYKQRSERYVFQECFECHLYSGKTRLVFFFLNSFFKSFAKC